MKIISFGLFYGALTDRSLGLNLSFDSNDSNVSVIMIKIHFKLCETIEIKNKSQWKRKSIKKYILYPIQHTTRNDELTRTVLYETVIDLTCK